MVAGAISPVGISAGRFIPSMDVNPDTTGQFISYKPTLSFSDGSVTYTAQGRFLYLAPKVVYVESQWVITGGTGTLNCQGTLPIQYNALSNITPWWSNNYQPSTFAGTFTNTNTNALVPITGFLPSLHSQPTNAVALYFATNPMASVATTGVAPGSFIINISGTYGTI